VLASGSFMSGASPKAVEITPEENAARMIREGRYTFRHDTFGDEDFWGGELRLHEAVATLSPTAALAAGLKVDSEQLPPSLKRALLSGDVNLEDPKVTLELLALDAVVGVKGFLSEGALTSIGIQCAICHSTVDDSFQPGMGRRLDGWANRDLDIGLIASLAPDLTPVATLLGVTPEEVKQVFLSWGPGKFDAELLLDGQSTGPNGSSATLIPPAFGLAGVNLHTWTGWGGVSHWNAFVANIEMHGKGTFFDPRLDDPQQFPVAAAAVSENVRAMRSASASIEPGWLELPVSSGVTDTPGANQGRPRAASMPTAARADSRRLVNGES